MTGSFAGNKSNSAKLITSPNLCDCVRVTTQAGNAGLTTADTDGLEFSKVFSTTSGVGKNAFPAKSLPRMRASPHSSKHEYMPIFTGAETKVERRNTVCNSALKVLIFTPDTRASEPQNKPFEKG